METGKRCIRCGNYLTNKQQKYCSHKCIKLYLKSLYRKRNRDKINAYNKKVRKLGIRGDGKKLIKRFKHLQTGKCAICESKVNLEVHHIKPRRLGGLNESHNLILLCKKCHYQMESVNIKL